MSRQIVREAGQCTQCGITATHANECVMCHVVTLCATVIKSAYHAGQIRSVAEDMAETDLFRDAKDTNAPGTVRRIAATITRLSLSNKLHVRDVQRKLVTRLVEAAEMHASETPESKADYIARIMDWLGILKTKFK